MRLADLRYANLEPYGDLEIEDVVFFHAMAFRMIEDVEVVIYTTAKKNHQDAVDETTVCEALELIASGASGDRVPVDKTVTFEDAPIEAFVHLQMVHDLARAPLPHQRQALELISKYLNYQLSNMLFVAARQARQDGLPTIKLRHYLPYCEEWPWPFNRYC